MVLAGCGLFREPATELEPVALRAEDPLPAQLLADWERQLVGRQALRGSASLKLTGQGGSQRLDQNVVLARPARLRMEIQAFLVTAAVLVVDRNRYAYHQSVDDIHDAGPLYPGLLNDIAGVPLRLDQAVHFLLGAPPPRPDLRVAAARRYPDGSIELDLEDRAARLVRRQRFDAEGRLVHAMEWAPSGPLVWEVGYDRFKVLGGQPFAHRIAFDFPRYGSRATVAYRSVELNPETPDAVFRLDSDPEAPRR